MSTMTAADRMPHGEAVEHAIPATRGVDWAALEADPRVSFSATGSWLDCEGGDDR